MMRFGPWGAPPAYRPESLVSETVGGVPDPAKTETIAMFVSAVVGHFIVVLDLWLLELKYGPSPHRSSFVDPLDTYSGCLERAIATTLIFYAPNYLAAFVGGWIALKFALTWQRRKGGEGEGKEKEDQIIRRSFIALTGNVVSFAFAILVGVIFHPQALVVWSSSPIPL